PVRGRSPAPRSRRVPLGRRPGSLLGVRDAGGRRTSRRPPTSVLVEALKEEGATKRRRKPRKRRREEGVGVAQHAPGPSGETAPPLDWAWVLGSIFALALLVRTLYLLSIRHAFFFDHLVTEPARYDA